MAGKCDICGKAHMVGYNVSHSKRHTKRHWLPNVHRAMVVIDGQRRRLNLCTRCLRTQRKIVR